MTTGSARSPLPANPYCAHLGCIESRLVKNRALTIESYGGGYGISVAGAAAALFTASDGPTVLRQFIYGYAVKPFELIVARIHMDCGMLKVLTGPGGPLPIMGEHRGLYDPAQADQMFSLASAGLTVIQAGLLEAHRVEVPGVTEVVDIRNWLDGEPYGIPLERPEVCAPLADKFYERYGQHLRPVAA